VRTNQEGAVIANVSNRGASMPRILRTLHNTIAALFGKKPNEGEVDRILRDLQMRKALSIYETKIQYQLCG